MSLEIGPINTEIRLY